MIFSRDRGRADRQGKAGDAGRGRGRHVRDGDRELPDVDELDPAAEPVLAGPTRGPYDVSEAPDDGIDRFDLGALQVPQIAGVEIRLQAGDEGRVQQVTLLHGASGLQVGVFAAPRTEGIWDEVRADLRASLAREGAKPEELPGEYGMELRARVRSPDGPLNIRFVGVDGPRWFVRAMFQGAAAADPDRAGPLRDALHGLVVNRGSEAMPVREALPLRLPASAMASLTEVVTEPPPAVSGRASVPPASGRATASPATASPATASPATASPATASPGGPAAGSPARPAAAAPPGASPAGANPPTAARPRKTAVSPLGIPTSSEPETPATTDGRQERPTDITPSRPRNRGRSPRSGRR